MNFITSIILYFLNIIHLIALIITLKFLRSKFISFSKEGGLGYGTIAITTIFIAGSILFFIFEGNSNPTGTVFKDSTWFSLVSITTTDYGDIVPNNIRWTSCWWNFNDKRGFFCHLYTLSLARSIFSRLREERRSREKTWIIIIKIIRKI